MQTARDSLQVRARLKRVDPDGGQPRFSPNRWLRVVRNQIMASASPRTQVAFVTAYDQYAIDAFDTGAVDYLLKPIALDRLAHTVQRLRARLANGSGDSQALAVLLQQLSVALPRKLASEPLVWLTASTGNATRLILVEDVLYFRADNKYTVVMTATGDALLRKPIKDLLKVLDPATFKQIHRSTIVNPKAIDAITRDDSGKGYLTLKSRPETLTVSQPFMGLFRSR